jgi:thiazole synthase
MIPRTDGRLLLGATVDDVGFAPGPTPAGIAWLVHEAVGVMPSIASLPIRETWAGYRPGTPDALPILGGDPDVNGLHYATGHYRNGILLAPVTAEVTVASINGSVPDYAKPFSIARFGSMS